MNTYKGDLLDTGVNFAFGLVFIGILAGAGGVALASFGTGLTGTAASIVATPRLDSPTWRLSCQLWVRLLELD
jgi:hypothetical protein